MLTMHLLCSMSKSLVAITVLLLQQRGLLSLDVHLAQYLACFDTADLRAKRSLTLRSVLCHTSGAPLDGGEPGNASTDADAAVHV
jgi:CubicO group peptidase (beta-lactamase class C family)